MREGIVVFLLFFLLQGCSSKEVQTDKKPQMSQRLVIHYHPWTTSTYKSLSCADLEGSSDSIVVRDSAKISGLERALTNAVLTPAPEMDDLDVRICCTLFGQQDSILHSVAFAQSPIMRIDGKIVQRDKTLFEMILDLLPEGYLGDWSDQGL